MDVFSEGMGQSMISMSIEIKIRAQLSRDTRG